MYLFRYFGILNLGLTIPMFADGFDNDEEAENGFLCIKKKKEKTVLFNLYFGVLVQTKNSESLGTSATKCRSCEFNSILPHF